MAAREVVGRVVLPGGQAPRRAVVTIELVASTTGPALGWVPTADKGVGGQTKFTTITGDWSVLLEPNTLITPAGTAYRFTYTVDGWSSQFHVTVPDTVGPHRVEDVLTDAPASLLSAPLSDHLADTTAVHGIADTAALALDANVVHKTGNETVAGEKTFTGKARFPTDDALIGIGASGAAGTYVDLGSFADPTSVWIDARSDIGTANTSMNFRTKGTGKFVFNNGPVEVVSVREAIATNAAATGAVTVDLTAGAAHVLTLVGPTTLTLAGAVTGRACTLNLRLIQDATGGRTVTWPASVKWSGGTAASISTTANAMTMLELITYDGGTTWFGHLSGKDYA